METKEVSDKLGEVAIMDTLIINKFKELLNYKDEKPKSGDIVKMMEYRRQLSPTDREQKKFWKMINQIRQEKMSQPKKKPTQPSGNKK